MVWLTDWQHCTTYMFLNYSNVNESYFFHLWNNRPCKHSFYQIPIVDHLLETRWLLIYLSKLISFHVKTNLTPWSHIHVNIKVWLTLYQWLLLDMMLFRWYGDIPDCKLWLLRNNLLIPHCIGFELLCLNSSVAFFAQWYVWHKCKFAQNCRSQVMEGVLCATLTHLVLMNSMTTFLTLI